MSRAAKAAGGKDKGKPPVSTTPVVMHEIVPGKFNENDWNTMLERDAAEDFVLDFVDEIMYHTMDTIYKNYIQRQLLPFTITQAKDAILQIIEWQFLARDEGESDITDLSWTQDEEPEAATTDCWAQGSVPKTEIAFPTPIPEEPEEAELIEEAELKAEEVAEPEEPELADHVSEAGDAQPESTEEAEKAAEADAQAEASKDKKKKPFKPYRGKMKSAGVSKMTESLDETEMKMIASEIEASMPPQEVSGNLLTMPASCSSILKVQNGRPPGTKDVEYDDMGNVIAVMKLDAERLPNHRVSVKYQVVDPAVEAAQARLEAMRRGRYIAPSQQQLTKTKSKKSVHSETLTATTSASAAAQKGGSKPRKPIMTQLPPSLIETMEVAAGVQVTEAGRVKKGPGRYVRKADQLDQHQKNLQPVTIRIKSSGISVSDLLDRNTPVLRPMQETPPLPPIVPQPPSGPSVKT